MDSERPIAPLPEENGSDEQSSESTLEVSGNDVDLLTPPPQSEEGSSGPVDVSIGSNASVEWNEEHATPALAYPVVGIGASAGGLQALRELLDHLPEETGMSYVLVSHLAVDQRSYLAEILSRHTSMKVLPIEEGVRPQPDHFYVLQPGQIATLQSGFFRLEHKHATDRFPIDIFFRSLGSDQKTYCVGVILSGADSDGALGLKSLKGDGGLSIAQSPETAQQAGMPISSIEMDHVDYVGSPSGIAAELARLAQLYGLPQIHSLGAGSSVSDQEENLQLVLQVLRNATGLDLRQYKPETIRRRIARRMMVRRTESLSDYARILQSHRDEVRALYEDALINVTRFFRDPELWHTMSAQLLPTLFKGRPVEKPVRIWCAGCATGEEPYSLAIAVLEYLTANGMDTAVQIFATDASESAVQHAREGTYPESLISEVGADRLRRFFVKVDRGYQISKRVRDCCVFARQNLMSDPPFSHIDILSCRNVLIYFNQALQKQVISTFHYALEPNGYLLLGLSESLRDYGDYFRVFDRKSKTYAKTDSLPVAAVLVPRAHTTNLFPLSMRERFISSTEEAWTEVDLQRAADRMVLSGYAPAGLVIDERLKVLQVRGQTSPYVELAPGTVSWNLFRVLREGIGSNVREGIERAIRENVPISINSTLAGDNHTSEPLRVDILPIASSSARPRCFLVLFSSGHDAGKDRLFEQTLPPEITGDEREKALLQLRQDLTSTRFRLQSLVEERDARNQELVSANEEIQSANEELQSTNEELETTKEELQSTNEELQTVNDELRQRNANLAQTGNDLANLLNSVNMPLLMLTEDLKIRQFTPPMERMLNIRSSDVGRSIREIRLQLSIEDIEPILLEVMDTLAPRELEVKDRDGKWHLLRVRPYRTSENKIDGLVVLLVDIDQLRTSQEQLRNARDFARSVVQAVPVPVVVLEMDGTIRMSNNSFRELTQLEESALAGRSLADLVGVLWGVDDFRTKLQNLAQSADGTFLEFEHRSTTTQSRILLIKGQPLHADGSRILLLTFEDITLRRREEESNSRREIALQDEIAASGRTLLRTQQELRELTAHLLTAQEDERQRVSRELHDDVSQRLTRLEMLCAKLEPKDDSDLRSIREEVRSLNDDVRSISHRLHPAILNDLGLAEALHALVDDFRVHQNMPASYSTAGLPEQIPAYVTTSLYRICQEALRNVTKHAGTTHVKVELEGQDHIVRMRVRDFGTGFDQDAEFPIRGLGLISMEERARIAGGTFSIASSLGNGTTVEVAIPVREHD